MPPTELPPTETEDETTKGGPPAEIPPTPKQKVPGAQLIVNQTVIHQLTYGQAQELVPHQDGSFVALIDSTEQPISKDYSVGPDWQPLSLWWLADKPISHLIFVNREGRFRGGNPTPEHKALVLSRTVEVGVVEKAHPVVRCALVPPQESSRFRPVPGALYFVRCPNGPAKLTIAAVPGD